MSDTLKAQKLAAARKMLKEHQRKNQKPPTRHPENKESLTPLGAQSATDSLTSSTQSLNAIQNVVGAYGEISTTEDASANSEIPVAQETSASPLQNYFSMGGDSMQPSGNFFDHYAANNFVSNQFATQFSGQGDIGNFIATQTPFVVNDISGTVNNGIINADVTALDYPEVKHNEVFDRLNSKEELHDELNIDTKQSHDNSFQGNNYFQNNDEIKTTIEFTPLLSENKEDLTQNNDFIIQNKSFITENVHHNVEGNVRDMEEKNQELIRLLEEEKLKSQSLANELDVCRDRILKQQNEIDETKQAFENIRIQEVQPLQEKLEYHMQTFGILVAEKSELMQSLNQSQSVAKLKSEECEELQGRLKTSRSRAADLEKELNNIKAEKMRYDKAGSDKHEEVEILKRELDLIKEQKEEVLQDLSEVKEKLNISANDNLRLQEEVQEMSKHLSLANVKIQQLSSDDYHRDIDKEVQELVEQKQILEKHISELHQTLKTVTNERDQAGIQYQQYTQQLNAQLTSIAQKLESTTQQNEALLKRDQELVQHIGELEKHLQSVQNEHVNFTMYKNNNDLKKELEEMAQKLEQLEKEKVILDNKLESYKTENEDLLKDLAAKKDAISEMENKIERLEGNQPDSAKLLAAMESDKVAAARAVTQNAQLKKQLEDMEEVFIKMSNDKLELTEHLTSAQHYNKELHEKLQQTETQLHTLAEAIEIKDRELTLIRDGSTELNKQILQQNQLSDRLRHYEAQEHAFAAVQQELQDANKTIEELTKENVYLKQQRIEVASESHVYTINPDTTNSDTVNTGGENNGDYDVLKQTIEELERTNKDLQQRLNEMTINQMNQTDMDKENHAAVHAITLDKEAAMKQLEGKFKKMMEDIANLHDEKQRLEHVVLQLQGETETIGEYIALYQHQRGILKLRAAEKENQLTKIASDREQMRFKLEQLNSLVRRLIADKNIVSSEFLEEHKQITEENVGSNHLCTEHHDHSHDKITNGVMNEVNVFNNNKVETAQKIIDLLSEIKTNNLVQSTELTESFHPCPCCSGHLLNV